MRRYLCKWGWHRFRFISMAYVRYVSYRPYGDALYDVKESCCDCGLKRTRRAVPLPKRVQT